MLESLLTVLAISLDSLAIGIAYGIKKIKIPKMSLLTINIICTVFLLAAIFLGEIIGRVLPGNVAPIISFLILLFLGLFYIFEGLVKSSIQETEKANKKIELHFPNIDIIISIFIDGTKADMNKSGDIDLKEAVYLGIALSLDSLAVGFGSSLGNINHCQVVLMFFVFNLLFIVFGLHVGEKFASKTKLNFSLISGLILIFLGVSKLLG